MTQPVPDASADLQHGTFRFPPAIFTVAVAFSTFQIGHGGVQPAVQHGRARRARRLPAADGLPADAAAPRRRWIGWIVGGLGFVFGFYHWIFEADLIQRAGDLTDCDMVIGIVTIVLVFEAARRVMGIALPIICAAFLALRDCSGSTCPARSRIAATRFDQVVDQLGFGTEGIYGTPDLRVVARTSSCSSCSAPSSSRRA